MKLYSTIDDALRGKVDSSLPREPEFLISLTATRRANVLPSLEKEVSDKSLEDFLFEPVPSQTPAKYFVRSRLSSAAVNREFSLIREKRVSGVAVGSTDMIDNIIYWDERRGCLYLEAIAYFESPEEFVKFRRDIPTDLHLDDHNCPICQGKEWLVKDVDAKTVVDKGGRRWKCFSIIFLCKRCFDAGRTTTRQIAILGFKHTLTKLGIGVRDFVDRARKVRIGGNLGEGSAEGELELDKKQRSDITRCPLLG